MAFVSRFRAALSAGLTAFALACDCHGAGTGVLPDPLVDVWDTEDGLPNSTVTAVAQTPDGYLWVGTYNGLARFDGVKFVTFDPVTTPELRNARVQALYVDCTGNLWINNYRGALTRYRDGVFYAEETGEGGYDWHETMAVSTSNEVTFIGQFGDVLRRSLTGASQKWTVTTREGGTRPIFQCADRNGILWFLTREGRICQFIDGSFVNMKDSGGLTNRVLTLVLDDRGRVWAGAENEIAVWNGRNFVDMTPTNGEAAFEPNLLFPTRSGALWVLAGDRLRKQVGRQWVAEAT
ncbi:MAG TPA: two-component regulator propeller domain-containing protein, partial [Verrucomicrobiae bacterium]